MDKPITIQPVVAPRDACCGAEQTCQAPGVPATAADVAPPADGWVRFRVPTMDCAVEESEIRRAVDGIAGVRALTFQLGQRTLALDASEPAVALAIAAIRKAGFDPQPVAPAVPGQAEVTDDHDHAPASGWWRLGLALAFALGAEGVGFFAPDTWAWEGVGLAVAAVAIWLAGIDVYKKGLTALLRGRLNINALMTVAVTGAFVIG